jgi:hypothetical protein
MEACQLTFPYTSGLLSEILSNVHAIWYGSGQKQET